MSENNPLSLSTASKGLCHWSFVRQIHKYLVYSWSSTLREYVPLHDPDGGVVLVAAGSHAIGIDQIPVWAGRPSLQGLLALSEQLVRVNLGEVLVQVLVLLQVRVWLGQGAAVQ